MDHHHSTHSWVGSFAGRLLQLRPELGIGSAVNYAVHSIHHAADLDPQRAAEIFVIANPSGEAARARRGERKSEPPSAQYRALFGFSLAQAG